MEHRLRHRLLGAIAVAGLLSLTPAACRQAPVPAADKAKATPSSIRLVGAEDVTAAIFADTYAATQPSGRYGVVGYQFNALQDYGSFGDGNTHIGFVVNGGKSVSRADTTGSWTVLDAQYTGYAGGSPASFITAGMAMVRPKASGANTRGNWTGWNPICRADAGLSPTSCVGEEVNVETHVAPANVRQGVRIVDTGSAAGTFGRITDSALGIGRGAGAAGWRAAILLGDEGQAGTFPVAADGDILRSAPTAVALRSFLDFSAITAAPRIAGLVLPSNSRGLCFGATCSGGSLLSTTTVNGPQIVLQDNLYSINWSAQVFSVDHGGNVAARGTVRAARVAVTPASPAASSPCAKGEIVADGNYVYVCVAANAWKRAALAGY